MFQTKHTRLNIGMASVPRQMSPAASSVPSPADPQELERFELALNGRTKSNGGGNIDYLRDKCVEFGISKLGTRPVLVQRLRAAWKNANNRSYRKNIAPAGKGSTPAGKDSTPAGNTFDQQHILAQESVIIGLHMRRLDKDTQFCAKKLENLEKHQQITGKQLEHVVEQRLLFDAGKKLSDDKKVWVNEMVEESISLIKGGIMTDRAQIDVLEQEIGNLLFNAAKGRLKSASALLDPNGQPPQDTQPSPPPSPPQPAKPTPPASEPLPLRVILRRESNSGVVDNLSDKGITNIRLDHLVKNHFIQISRKASDFYETKHRHRPDNIRVDHEKFDKVNVYGPKDYQLIIDAVKFVNNSHRRV